MRTPLRYAFTCSIAIVVPLSASAQCSVTIPDNVIVMSVTDSSTSVIGQSMIICPGVYVSASSIDPVIFLESGAHMNFSGFSKNIYAKAGSIVDGSGIDDTIYYEVGAQLLIGGINQTLIECDPLTFDFSPNGTSPCDLVSTVSTSASVPVMLLPSANPGTLTVEWPGSSAPLNITVFDGFGRTVLHGTSNASNGTVDVSALSSGTYSALIECGARRWVGRFVRW